MAAETDEELEALSMQHPILKDAKDALDKLSADPDARERAERREIDCRGLQVLVVGSALWRFQVFDEECVDQRLFRGKQRAGRVAQLAVRVDQCRASAACFFTSFDGRRAVRCRRRLRRAIGAYDGRIRRRLSGTAVGHRALSSLTALANGSSADRELLAGSPRHVARRVPQ